MNKTTPKADPEYPEPGLEDFGDPRDPIEQLADRLQTTLLGSRALSKACMDDPFDYALKLRTGEVIAFSGASVLNAEWVHLSVKHRSEQPDENGLPYPAERGMDVRLSDIVWVMDAPNGS